MSGRLFLSIEGLEVRFPVRSGLFGRPTAWRSAVRGVSLPVFERETLGLVGESGSGKSTLARALLRLAPTAAGRVILDEADDVLAFAGPRLAAWRRSAQLVYQDPYSSLDPRYRILDTVAEPLAVAGVPRAEARERAAGLLGRMGFRPEDHAKYPHEFSGGQRQRVGIARALALKPRLLVGDEPVSALDVSIQAQILRLLAELKAEFGLTVLFISHDLSVVRTIADRIAVLYAGRIVEYGPSETIFDHPLHPYTRELIDAVPEIGALPPAGTAPESCGRRTPGAPTYPASAATNDPDPPDDAGCPFRARCPLADGRCARDLPRLLETLPGRSVACHRQAESAREPAPSDVKEA